VRGWIRQRFGRRAESVSFRLQPGADQAPFVRALAARTDVDRLTRDGS
jgi:hypothetical protein